MDGRRINLSIYTHSFVVASWCWRWNGPFTGHTPLFKGATAASLVSAAADIFVDLPVCLGNEFQNADWLKRVLGRRVQQFFDRG